MSKEKKYCSFCGKSQNEVERLIAGKDVYICNECIDLCSEIIEEDLEEDNENNTSSSKDIPSPKQIKNHLDQYVIGQDDAKITLAVAVYNHYKRIKQKKSRKGKDNIELQKSNILMLGETGSGKTLLAQTIAKMLNVPFVIVDATTYTEAGYVGDDVENILLRLIQNADFDIEKAEKGIVYIDEIDKIANKSENASLTKNVGDKGVQQALLKIIEGTISRVPEQGGRKHPYGECLEIDTTNILFICGGAFDGIHNILKSKTIKHNSIGFGATIEKEKNDISLDTIEPSDIIKYGFMPEFVGRLPVITTLKPLDKDLLLKILTEPKNSIIKQYQKLFDIDNLKLEFESEALEAIVNKAISKNTGARGLRAIIETALKTIMFEIPDIEEAYKVVVTKDVINGTGSAIIYNKENKMIA